MPRFVSLTLLIAALLITTSCGSPSLDIGGVVLQSLDIEEPIVVIVGGDDSRRPPTDLGPLVNARVGVVMREAPKRILQTTTDRNGQFTVTYPGKMIGKLGTFVITFRQKGFEAVRFQLSAEDLRRAHMESGERTYYVEYWVPYLEPGG